MPFINFASVNPLTDLTELNLNWQEADLPERERTKHVHRLHPYLGKFIPQLAEVFLRKYAREQVVDPFCGSGTALVEASILGIDSFGADISEFNVLLSRVKTKDYRLGNLEVALWEAYQATEARLKASPLDAKEATSEYLARWYTDKARRELLAYREQINRFSFSEVMQIILARAARSARRVAHFDLDFPTEPVTEPYYCRKHKKICYPTEQALPFLKRYTGDTIRRIQTYVQLRTEAEVSVVCGDSRQVEFPFCDLVLTSPPYVGLIDYHEQHRYAYELLGLADRRQAEIGPACQGKSKAAQAAYVEGITDVLDNVSRKVVAGGTIVVVVHDRYQLYPGIGKKLGLSPEVILRRQVNRRTGRRATNFYENIYIWKKLT